MVGAKRAKKVSWNYVLARKGYHMHAAVRRVRVHQGLGDEIIRRAKDEQLPLLSKLPGFVSYDIFSLEHDFFMSISVFETSESVEKSNQVFREWGQKFDLPAVLDGPPELLNGELLVHTTKS